MFIDTEARKEYSRGLEVQRWRCGVAIYATRKRSGDYATDTRDYRDAKALWQDVSDFASSQGRTVAWCHNLSYDVRIGDMFTLLPILGWRLQGHNITSRGTWLEWKRDGETLVFVDSLSVFPASIARIGAWFDAVKPELPSDDADMGTWLDRCRADCSILSRSILRYLRWIKEEDLGNWQLTGNAQSWAVFRHKFLTHDMVVHSEKDALDAERRAMWTGRCEAYWHGDLWGQRVFEYDFTNSYPRIARDHPVPVKYIGEMPMGRDWTEWLESETVGFVADCTIVTTVPVVPTKDDGRILWPVGTFNTTLWDREISAVLDSGGAVTVQRGWMYRKAPALKAWAEWILGRLSGESGEIPAWERAVLKHWSRALIGRMSMSYQKWDYDGDMPTSKVEAGFFKEAGTGELSQYVQIGESMWTHQGREEWKHSMPMVTGYIQAVARVQLWEVLRRMPFRSVLYVDTDSVFVTEEFQADIEEVIAEIPGCGMRLKRAWDGMSIFGPRQIITGQEVRISGVPKMAEKVGRLEFVGEIWEGVDTAIRLGHADNVQVRDRRWLISGVDRRRMGTGFGWTEPFELPTGD